MLFDSPHNISLPLCCYLVPTVSEVSATDWSKIAILYFYMYILYVTSPTEMPRFDLYRLVLRKQEWWSYRAVKEFRRYMFSHLGIILDGRNISVYQYRACIYEYGKCGCTIRSVQCTIHRSRSHSNLRAIDRRRSLKSAGWLQTYRQQFASLYVCYRTINNTSLYMLYAARLCF